MGKYIVKFERGRCFRRREKKQRLYPCKLRGVQKKVQRRCKERGKKKMERKKRRDKNVREEIEKGTNARIMDKSHVLSNVTFYLFIPLLILIPSIFLPYTRVPRSQ